MQNKYSEICAQLRGQLHLKSTVGRHENIASKNTDFKTAGGQRPAFI